MPSTYDDRSRILSGSDACAPIGIFLGHSVASGPSLTGAGHDETLPPWRAVFLFTFLPPSARCEFFPVFIPTWDTGGLENVWTSVHVWEQLKWKTDTSRASGVEAGGARL